MLIGVTDESPALVDEWMERVQPEYPIVCLKDDAFEKFLGVRFFPTGAVIDPDGKLAFAGSAGAVEGALGEAMRKTSKSPLFPKVFKKVTKALREGDYAKSHGELVKLLERGRWDEGEESLARNLKQHHEDLAADALAEARQWREDNRIYRAVQVLAPFVDVDPPFAISGDARAFLQELEALPEYELEMSGGEDFAEAEALEDASEFEDAFDAYRSIAKKASGSRIGNVALENARRLMESGQPGWSESCGACRASRGQKACSKHEKKVRL